MYFYILMRRDFKSIFNLGKFSNVSIFERRLKEREKLLSEQKNKNSHSLTLKFNKSNQFSLTNSTLPSTKRTIILTSNKKMKNKQFINLNTFYSNCNNSSPNPFDNSTKMSKNNSDNFSNIFPNNFYITENPKKKTTINLKKKFKIIPLINDTSFTSNKKNYDQIHLLRKFEDEKIKHLLNLKKKIEIENKRNQINRIKESKSTNINKIRELKLLNHSIDIKKEKYLSLKESKENQIKEISYPLGILNNSISHCETFYNKFNDYVKHLSTQREFEKSMNKHLIQEIIILKKQNNEIESKIKKVQQDKNNILRWLYLQIEVYEKKVNIPDYYKIIIEESEENYNQIMNKRKRKESVDSQKKEKKFNHKKSFNIKKKLEKKESRKKINEDINEFNPIYNSISKEEIERIRHYRYVLKFNCIDELVDQFKQYEYDTLNYIDEYNSLKQRICELKKEKNIIINEGKIENDILDNDIKEKEKEHQILKAKNEYLLNEINNINNKNNINNINNNTIYNLNLPLQKNKSKLYFHIYNLYLTISQLNIDINVNYDLNAPFTQEEEMIIFLKKIEVYFNYLLNRFEIYNDINGKYYDDLKEIQNKIEKEHKILKTTIQKEKDKKQLERLKEQMEIRNNKINFLPRKKFEKYYVFGFKKQNKIKEKTVIKPLDINDFLYE